MKFEFKHKRLITLLASWVVGCGVFLLLIKISGLTRETFLPMACISGFATVVAVIVFSWIVGVK